MQTDWRDTIKAGDVLISPSGEQRLVYVATMHKPPFLSCVSLSIRRRSWTGRCYTVIGRSDLKYGWSKVEGVRVSGLKEKRRLDILLHILDKDQKRLTPEQVRDYP